jgi:hypothetical protein
LTSYCRSQILELCLEKAHSPFGGHGSALQHRCAVFAAAVRIANMQDAIPRKDKGMLLFTFLGNNEKRQPNVFYNFSFLFDVL